MYGLFSRNVVTMEINATRKDPAWVQSHGRAVLCFFFFWLIQLSGLLIFVGELGENLIPHISEGAGLDALTYWLRSHPAHTADFIE